MKKSILILSVVSAAFFMYSCKNKSDKNTPEETTTSTTPSENNTEAEEQATTASNEPKTYTVTALPDTAILGKDREAFIKIKDLKAVELSDPDGKSKGIEFTYKIELTNRKSIGESSVHVNTNNFRLELDNGQKIAPRSVYVSAQPEETQTSDEDKFEIPAGAKPVGMSLFLDDTRASIKLELK